MLVAAGPSAAKTVAGKAPHRMYLDPVIGDPSAGGRHTVLPVLAAAYRLTDREQEVVSCVFAGLSTREISSRLHISTYAVQDHLKAVFAKVGSTAAANSPTIPRSNSPDRFKGPDNPGRHASAH